MADGHEYRFRIDGYTPWSVLRHIGGLSPNEVDACLTRWLDEGHVVCAGEDESKSDAAVAESAAAEPADPDLEAFVVPGLDISADRQRQILVIGLAVLVLLVVSALWFKKSWFGRK